MFVIRNRRFGIANIKLVSLLEAAGHQERLIGKAKFTTMYQTAQIEHSLENVSFYRIFFCKYVFKLR